MRCAVQFAGEILAAEFRRSLLDLTYNGKLFDVISASPQLSDLVVDDWRFRVVPF
jgi:hypothetical protein